MNYILVILFSFSGGGDGETLKSFEMRIPQASYNECKKSSETFELSIPLPGISYKTQTRCQPRLDHQGPEVRDVDT